MAMAARLSGSKKKVGMMSPDERSALTPHAGPSLLDQGLEHVVSTTPSHWLLATSVLRRRNMIFSTHLAVEA